MAWREERGSARVVTATTILSRVVFGGAISRARGRSAMAARSRKRERFFSSGKRRNTSSGRGGKTFSRKSIHGLSSLKTSSRLTPRRASLLSLSACARAVTGSRAATRVRTRQPRASDCAAKEATPRRPWRRRRRRGVGSASRRTRRPSRRRFPFPEILFPTTLRRGAATRDPPRQPSRARRRLRRRRDARGPSAARAASRAPERARRASPRAGCRRRRERRRRGGRRRCPRAAASSPLPAVAAAFLRAGPRDAAAAAAASAAAVEPSAALRPAGLAPGDRSRRARRRPPAGL